MPFRRLLFAFCLVMISARSAHAREIAADLLVVGGTESGCAAAVQAARMGVRRIVLVNDIEWLGGQFSAEGLVAIDENRAPTHGKWEIPFPRSGLFLEVMDRLEAHNEAAYGRRRPGNTIVLTTCMPSAANRVFHELLAPYVESGQITVVSHMAPVAAETSEEGSRLTAVQFESTQGGEDQLTVRAKLTIDASDWGDVIRLSGAAYEFGPDLKSKYHEPLAPERREGYPLTDMNPITYNLLLEETEEYEPIPKPAGYDPRNYAAHAYPKDPLWIYPRRRVIDHYAYPEIEHPDVLLLCYAPFDYPLDVLPGPVAEALERGEAGASKKNIVELTRAQRQVVFEDAKQYSLGYLYHLQTEVHDAMPDTTHSFRRFKLSEDFGTEDRLPPKPYIRESLRLRAMYMLRQQDTAPISDAVDSYAAAMPHDAISAWQFEYDFHPTARKFLEPKNPHGPWTNTFRKGRTWGPPYSGRAQFPLRSLVPERVNGLLGAQKNLGYSSIVSSAVRLHDHSIAIGQGSGAVAAVALKHAVRPREIPFNAELMEEVRRGVCSRLDGGAPAVLWPFRDLAPADPAFEAANLLAARGCLPLSRQCVALLPAVPATPAWRAEVVERPPALLAVGHKPPVPSGEFTRGDFLIAWWNAVKDLPLRPYPRNDAKDADGDGIADTDDPLPLLAATQSLPEALTAAEEAAWLGPIEPLALPGRRFNFTGAGSPKSEGATNDCGDAFSTERGYGWNEDIRGNHRRRGLHRHAFYDTFLFTRGTHRWECELPNGTYEVIASIGDSGHEQPGQKLVIESKPAAENHHTAAGRFFVSTTEVEVRDGRLTIDIGSGREGCNTCLNWLVVREIE